MPALSAYRLMWMMVLFDLPTTTKAERKVANAFRKNLEQEGFERFQFSVYCRFIGSRANIPKFNARIKDLIPLHGTVTLIYFTDRQFREIVSFQNRSPLENAQKPAQLLLF